MQALRSPLLWNDLRFRAFALIAFIVVIGGLFIHWLPRENRVEKIASDPHQAEIDRHFAQGVMMLHAKQHQHAITAFHQVMRYAPQMPEAHVNMGFALLGLEKHAAARDFFLSAIELRKSQANAYFGLGDALRGLGDLDGAIGAMRTFLHLAPHEDKFRRRAESAIWEMDAARAKSSKSRKGNRP